MAVEFSCIKDVNEISMILAIFIRKAIRLLAYVQKTKKGSQALTASIHGNVEPNLPLII